jgi:hypothetical protein
MIILPETTSFFFDAVFPPFLQAVRVQRREKGGNRERGAVNACYVDGGKRRDEVRMYFRVEEYGVIHFQAEDRQAPYPQSIYSKTSL